MPIPGRIQGQFTKAELITILNALGKYKPTTALEESVRVETSRHIERMLSR